MGENNTPTALKGCGVKIILKIHKTIRSWPNTHTKESTCGIVHICKITEKSIEIVNEKISDLVHDFMNFNALKIILKIHKKYLRQIQV